MCIEYVPAAPAERPCSLASKHGTAHMQKRISVMQGRRHVEDMLAASPLNPRKRAAVSLRVYNCNFLNCVSTSSEMCTGRGPPWHALIRQGTTVKLPSIPPDRKVVDLSLISAICVLNVAVTVDIRDSTVLSIAAARSLAGVLF